MKNWRLVTIIGCDTGLDWTITHENGAVRLTAMDGETVLVDEFTYLEEVLRFAEENWRWRWKEKRYNNIEESYDRNMDLLVSHVYLF